MLIYRDGRLHKLTLIVGAHNGKDIVIGSDTMATVNDSGVTQPNELGHKKIYSISPKVTLALTGYFLERTFQFVKDFAFTNSSQADPLIVFDKLYKTAHNTLKPLDPSEVIQFIIYGFEDNKPWIKSFVLSGSSKDRIFIPDKNTYLAGYDAPRERADKLLTQKGVENNPQTSELKKIVKSVLKECIDEFPQELGGTPDMHVLHRD